MGSAVIITKSPLVLVKPSEPVTGFINLSSYDKPNIGRPVTALLVFDQAIDDPAETIKRGLSKALLYYGPMSGRLTAGGTAGGEAVIQYNGEGVSFVVASANCRVKDVQELEYPSLKEELAIFYPAGRVPGLHTDPLLLMQVTVFSCGGFVVGLTWDHSIADGTGIGQFMQAVGELSRGLPSPSVIPVRSDESLIGMPQATVRMFSILHSLRPSSPLVLLDIRVSSSLINRIKRDCSITCSVFEVFTAVVWQCRTRVVMEDPSAATILVFVANTRKNAGAKDGYYGSCFVAARVMTTCSVVANGDIMDVIKMIKRAKDQIPAQYSNDDDQQDQFDAESQLLGYNVFSVTGWRNLGVEMADFGGGRPARVMTYTRNRMRLPLCVSCLPSKDNEFFSGMSLCVKEEHAGAFLRELENFT